MPSKITFLFIFLINILLNIYFSFSIKLPLPNLVPIRYDIQLQLPTSSDKDPLLPTFIGTAKLEFQLNNNQQPSFDSQQQKYLINNELIKLTFLSQNLDQFENISLILSGEEENISFNVDVELRPPREVDFIIREEQKEGKKLISGRYILNIGRFEGIITYNKGLFYRDAGGLPLLSKYAPSLFPQLGGPLQKTTTKTLIQTQPPLFIWTNKLLHSTILKKELAQISGPVFESISSLLGNERLPLNSLNLLIIDDFNNTDFTHSFGFISISLNQWEISDQANKIAMLARQFARQWLGGMTTVANIGIFCLQEDIIEWLTHKVVKKVLNLLLLTNLNSIDKAWQRFQLAHYLKINLAELFLTPGESVDLPDWSGIEEIKSHCSFKGVQLFNSIEYLIGQKGELIMLSIIQRLLIQQRYRHFRLEHLDELLRPLLIDNIDIGQVFTFWFKNGGIPNLLIEKSLDKNKNNRLRLIQLNNGRQSQQLINGNIHHWNKMPLWPLPINIQNVTLPFQFMLSQVLELAPIDTKLLPLTNLGFNHLYRVNYDLNSWERIINELNDISIISSLNARSRAQLLGDFCYFNALNDNNDQNISKKDQLKIERLQRNFLQILRENYEYFELCEFYAFWCMAGNGRKIPMDRESRYLYLQIMEQNIWPALLNGNNYECGGPGSGFDAGNILCRAAFGQNFLI
ncbi:Peptidase_M1 domain-containing protein [Meloidogyne graminicola]|uniref:Peptidase_M1 domain-containing protein n=1 Tax=Meloidogyne graminicola TaxID=189291 RepID=A0A8S9ZKS8_9BILA|nr:Peptidase_M1 domain-containing protein [Meloidogyne graminicola]